MEIFITIFILVICIIILIICGVYLSKSLHILYSKTGDSNLQDAINHLLNADITAFAGGVGIVVIGILYLVFGLETAAFIGGYVSMGFLLVVIGITIAVGVLSIMGSISIHKINTTDPDIATAYHYAIIASSLAIGTVGLLVLLLGFNIYTRYKTPSAAQKQESLYPLEILLLKERLQSEHQLNMEYAQLLKTEGVQHVTTVKTM